LVLILAVLPRPWGRQRKLLGLGQQGMQLLHLAPAHCHFLM
jgi:hypothetical protein